MPTVTDFTLSNGMKPLCGQGLRSMRIATGLDTASFAEALRLDTAAYRRMERNAGGSNGSAEFQDDGTLEIEFNCADGDEAVLSAVRESFSAAC